MKTSGITRAAMLSLLLGSVVLACAAQDRPSDKNHPKEDNARPQANPNQHEQQQRPSGRQEQPVRQQQRQPAQSEEQRPAQLQQRPNESPQRDQQQRRQAPQEHRPAVSRQEEHNRQERGVAMRQDNQGQHRDQQAAWQQHRAANWQSDHRTWRQRGGYAGYRIPDNRFRGSFGPEHGFRIHGLPFRVVGGYPRFQYGGYWLSIVDPWPAEWGNDWYDNDQVYVVFVDNGYYLYNRNYPERGIAVSISM